jgi:hypothetical protein
VSPAAGQRFDESLASVARELHVVGLTVAAFAAALALLVWLERRYRSRWSAVPVATHVTTGSPYRSSDVVAAHLSRAPLLVRVASLASFTFGLLFTPLVLLAFVKYPFDGIAIPLVPGMALAVLHWGGAVMLLQRARFAAAVTRSGAVGSLMVNVGLLGIAAVHMFIVELDRHDGIEHACSSSVTFVVLVFALCSIALALLMKAALQAHEGVLTWTPSRVAVTPASGPSRRPASSAGEGWTDAVCILPTAAEGLGAAGRSAGR